MKMPSQDGSREYYAEVIARRTFLRKRVMCMTTYETLMVILSFLNCLLNVLIHYINNNKK